MHRNNLSHADVRMYTLQCITGCYNIVFHLAFNTKLWILFLKNLLQYIIHTYIFVNRNTVVTCTVRAYRSAPDLLTVINENSENSVGKSDPGVLTCC